jgi:serine/threonine protein kinase
MNADLVGKKIADRYLIQNRLGEGTFGVVYLATDEKIGRKVAIKIIRKDSQMTEAYTRFEREAQTLAKFNQPNIVPVHDFGEYEGAPYLVMAYIEGGTLGSHLREAYLYEKAIKLLVPVARALEYAHRNDIVHRDVKPGNILITSSGEPMLSDFGILKVLNMAGGTLGETNAGLGTAEYAAPEQWDNRITPQVDIYALGVILYELLTGRHPFTAENSSGMIFAHMNNPFPDPRMVIASIPDSIAEVVMKATQKKPEDRYASMDAMERAMEECLKARQSTDRKPVGKLTITFSLMSYQFQCGEDSARKSRSQPIDFEGEKWPQTIEQTVLSPSPQGSLKELGGVLYDRIFPKDVKDYLRGLAPNTYLSINTKDSHSDRIPWELFYDDTAQQFLCEKFATGRQYSRTVPLSTSSEPQRRHGKEFLFIAPVSEPGGTDSFLNWVGKSLQDCGIQSEFLQGSRADYMAVQRKIRHDFIGIHFAGRIGLTQTVRPGKRQKETEYALVLANNQLLTKSVLTTILKGRPFVMLDVLDIVKPQSTGELGVKWGEVVDGLANSFGLAGASAVISTRWGANRDKVSEFLELFYQETLYAISVGEALRLARSKFREQNPTDSTWAVFLLYGDPRVFLVEQKRQTKPKESISIPTEKLGPVSELDEPLDIVPPLETLPLFLGDNSNPLPEDKLNPNLFSRALFKMLSQGAQAEASLSGFDTIRTPHILLAMAGARGSLLEEIVQKMHSDSEQVFHAMHLVFAMPGGPYDNILHVDLTRSLLGDHTLQTLTAADELARREGQPIIQERHLLLALLAEKESIVSQGLHELDLESEQLLGIMNGETYKLRRYSLQQVLDIAAEEANRTGWDKIETPHLFIALTTLEYGCTRRAMWQQNMPPDVITESMRIAFTLAQTPSNPITNDDANIGARAHEVLDLAHREALQRGNPEVTDFEILSAIFMRADGTTPKLLEKIGITPSGILAYVEILNQSS